MVAMDFYDLILRLGLALAIGFLIGLERGWHERAEEEGHRAAGLRTFALIGLLGGIFGSLSAAGGHLLLAAGFVTTGTALAAFMWRDSENRHDFSATTLIAALLTFALGALAVLGDQAAAAAAAVATALLLAYKPLLHGFLERITWEELRSGLLLAAMTFIALPLLPNRAVDPWNALNPYELWLMTIFIAAISFVGYAAVKLVGARRGLMLSASLGGLVSSTAVTLALARLATTNRHHARMLAAGVLAAAAVMLPRVLVLAGLINWPLALALAPPILAAAAASAIVAVFLVGAPHEDAGQEGQDLAIRNPFELAAVLRFGALLAAVVFAVALARQYLGDAAVYGLAALSGFADVDAITLSMARGSHGLATASAAILIAVAMNTAAKSAYAWVGGGRAIGLWVLLGNAAAVAAGVLAWWKFS